MEKPMTKDLAKSTIIEMTEHVRDRLTGLPGVTSNAINTLVFGWIRAEQPQVLEALPADEICQVVGS